MSDENAAELLLRAVEIGENLIRIADTLDEDLAANYISAGLELLRARAEAALSLCEGRLNEPQALN